MKKRILFAAVAVLMLVGMESCFTSVRKCWKITYTDRIDGLTETVYEWGTKSEMNLIYLNSTYKNVTIEPNDARTMEDCQDLNYVK